MRIEGTEVKFSLSIREAQSLKEILKAVNDGKKHRIPFTFQFNDLPMGMFDDSKEIEVQLRNLLEV